MVDGSDWPLVIFGYWSWRKRWWLSLGLLLVVWLSLGSMCVFVSARLVHLELRGTESAGHCNTRAYRKLSRTWPYCLLARYISCY